MTRMIGGFLVLLAASLAVGTTGKAPSPAASSFDQLKALAGEWEGKDGAGNAVRTKFEPVAGGTAMLETLKMPSMEEMVTLYSVDGDGIALVHYCPTNNQPHMRSVPSAGEPGELVFLFQGATNLPDLATGHEQKLVMEFRGKNHIIERWTWRQNGKDTEMVYDFTRK
jgi:hypothetical protein